jgi:hypothetical protein
MTTTRKTQTLAQFSAAVDKHYERNVGFSAAVIALRQARDAAACVKARRAVAFEEIKARHLSGGMERRVHPGFDGTQFVVFSQSRRATFTRTVRADVIKKADRRAWEAARTWQRRVAVSAPRSHQFVYEGPKLPGLPKPSDDMRSLVRLYQHPVYEHLKELIENERVATETLDKIAADTGWSGEPLIFKDGWSIGLQALRYDPAALQSRDPDLYERLAVTVERESWSQLRIMDYDEALARGVLGEGALDLDEIDGE